MVFWAVENEVDVLFGRGGGVRAVGREVEFEGGAGGDAAAARDLGVFCVGRGAGDFPVQRGEGVGEVNGGGEGAEDVDVGFGAHVGQGGAAYVFDCEVGCGWRGGGEEVVQAGADGVELGWPDGVVGLDVDVPFVGVEALVDGFARWRGRFAWRAGEGVGL